MSSEILHIIRKDLLQARVLIGLLLAELVALTAIAGRSGQTGPGVFLLGMVEFLTIFLLVASLVLADSPTRADAFWKATPTSPITILSAKLLGVVLLVLPLLFVAEIVALVMNGIPIEQTLGFSFRSSMAIMFTLPTMMLVAAVTPNFKSFSVATILLATFNTLLSNTAFISSSVLEGNEMPWLRAIQYIPSIIIVIALCLVYVRKWTVDQSRVVAMAALVVVPVLQQIFQAGALSVTRRSGTTDKVLPATNYSATIKGDVILVKFAIKAPVANVQMNLANLSGRIKLSEGWYRLGTISTSAGFEGKVGKAFENGRSSSSGLPLGDSGDKSATVDGDSLRITVQFRFEPEIGEQIRKSDAPLSLNSTLVMEDLRTRLNVPADTQYHNGSVPGIAFNVVPIPDSGHWLRVRGRSLGPSGNPVGEVFMYDWNSSLAKRLRSYGYSAWAGGDDTAMLVSRSKPDTLRFRRRGAGGRSDDIFLPVPFSVIHDVNIDLKPDSAFAGVDLREFIEHARFEYRGWKYLSHIRLVADIPIARP